MMCYILVQLRLLMLLLGSEQWRYFPLAMQFLSSEFAPLLHGLPLPPSHVSITIAPPEVPPYPVLQQSMTPCTDVYRVSMIKER